MSHFSNILFLSFFFVAGSQQEIIIPADLPLVQELGATLREWAQIWHKLFVVCVDCVTLISCPVCTHMGLFHTHGLAGLTGASPFEDLTFTYDALHPCSIIEETSHKAPLIQC